MTLPREFLIEERLEKFRNVTSCNLGESGLQNFTFGEVISLCNIQIDELYSLSLKDSPNNGSLALRTEISSLYNSIDPNSILITTGTSEALYLFFKTILNKKTRVGYFSPAFQALYEIPLLCGASLSPVDILTGKNFETLFKNSDLVILNHPHNPTGISFSPEDWKEIDYWNQKYNRTLLFDEHYQFLNYKDLPFQSGMDREGQIYATGSITKSFGVTGLRIGWIIGDPILLKKIRSYKDYITHTVNPISEFLALHILKKKDQILPAIISRVKDNIKTFDLAFKELKSLEDYIEPLGGLVCFPKLKKGATSELYADELKKNCDIFVLPGINFEREGYIRVGFGESNENFKNGLYRWIEWEKKNERK